MGFFDRFTGKKPTASTTAAPATPASPASTPAPPEANTAAPAESPTTAAPPPKPGAPGGIIPRLAQARELLEAKDLPGAFAIYEEVLASAGDRADVLVTISGDLGTNGHVEQIVELIAPRYDAERHGPAAGINLLQAYLALRNPTAAQHVLDILFELRRPDLEERLFGFSNAIADMMATPEAPPAPGHGSNAPSEPAKIALISISKPIWFYGLEPLAARLLPPKEGRLRRVAFAQLSLPGMPGLAEAMIRPEEELGRLSRGIPLWLTETFFFSPHYLPIAAIGVLDRPVEGKSYALFGTEWSTDNLRQLVDTTEGGLDYVFTGALREQSGDYELVLRVWEVKKFRERKMFSARWNPGSFDSELAKLHEQIRLFMEWTPEKAGLPYAAPASPRAWVETLGTSLSLFLATNGILPKEQLAPLDPAWRTLASQTAATPAASLAWLTSLARAQRLWLPSPAVVASLAGDPVVAEAKQALAV